MFSAIGRHLRPSPAGAIALMALFFAMLGGAYAASGGLTAKEKKQVKSIAKSFQGTGPAGAQGAPGPKGDKGDAGAAGAAGKSAEGTPFSGSKTIGSVSCTEGGLEVKSASATTLVCNGVKGEEGEPGPLLSVYPPETLVQGTWNVQPVGTPSLGTVSISFPFPISTALTSGTIQFIKPGAETTQCPGEGEAQKGFLCLYQQFDSNEIILEIPQKIAGSSFTGYKTGANLLFSGDPGELASGVWTLNTP
jgi:hypothetical protein